MFEEVTLTGSHNRQAMIENKTDQNPRRWLCFHFRIQCLVNKLLESSMKRLTSADWLGGKLIPDLNPRQVRRYFHRT